MPSPVDIRPDHLEIVQSILHEHLPAGVKVWVFGSRANWTTKDSSDLDLALEGESKLSHKVLGALKDAFEDSALPYTVDVVDLNRIGDSFKQIVKSQRAPLPIDGDGTTAGDWIQCTVAEACGSINYGLTASASSRSDGPKFLRITDIVSGQIDWNTVPHVEADDDTVAKYRLHDGDIVIARTGASTGTSAYVSDPPPSVFASYLVRLQAKPEFDARFLAYYLKSREFWDFIRGVLGDKSAQPNASASTMTAAPFRAPRDEAEQRAIAHVLGTLDDKIELNRRMNETLETMARALFKSWFVDFEPVRAKIEGRWRRGESLPGLPAEHYDLFPNRLVDSELGEIPEGWEVKALGEVVQLNPREPMKRGTLAPYLDMAAMPTSGSSPDSPVLREYKSGTRFRNGDTLLARITPCLENGKTAFVQSLATGTVGWGSTEFIVLRAVPPVPPEYTYLLARDAGFREHAIQSMTGTSGRQRVQVDALLPYSLPNPPAEVWTEFSALISPIYAQIEVNRQESLALAAQRDTLLPGLVSGEVGVAELSTLV